MMELVYIEIGQIIANLIQQTDRAYRGGDGGGEHGNNGCMFG